MGWILKLFSYNDGRGMRYDTVLFIIGVLLQVAQMFSSFWSGNGPEKIYLTVSSMSMLILFCWFWLVSSQQNKRILDEISKRMPGAFVVSGAERISSLLIEAVMDAEEFIYATGSAARDIKFLNTIEKSISNSGSNIQYKRILFKRHMKKPLLDHIIKIIINNNCSISFVNEDHYGYYLVTDKDAILVIPSNSSRFMLAVHFRDAKKVDLFRQAFTNLLSESERISSANEAEGLFEKLKSFGS